MKWTGWQFAIAVFVVTLAVAVVPAGQAAGATGECRAIDGEQLCLTDVSLSSQQLVVGETGTLSFTIENEGASESTAAVILVTVDPTNETNAYQLREATLQPGASETFTRDLDANNPGTHSLQLRLIDPETQRRFDTSEVQTIDILAEPPARLGGPIDRTEIALVALAGALLGLGVLGYRQFG